MPQIRKAGIQTQFNDITGNQSATDGSFSSVSNVVNPVYEITPKFADFTGYTTQSTTGTLTQSIGTANANRLFLLTGLSVTYYKDVNCDIATGYITVSILPAHFGTTQAIYNFPVTTLTAEKDSVILDFSYPILLRSAVTTGTVVSVTGTFAAGVLVRSVSIRGIIL